MSTSIHAGLVDLSEGHFGVATHPADTAQLRDGVANGLLHIADSYAQVRVNYCPIATGFATNDLDAFETIDADPIADRWYQVGAPFGEWPITCSADGTPYTMRVRLGVSGSTTDAGITHEYRVVLAPLGRGREEMLRLEDHVFEVSAAASATPSWASGATLRTSLTTTMLVTRALAAEWTQRVSAWDAVSSASPVGIDQVLLAAYVFARTDDVASLPQVNRLYLAEYVGL